MRRLAIIKARNGVRVILRPATVEDTSAGNRGGFVDYTKYNYCSSCNKRHPKDSLWCDCGDRLRVKSKHSRMRNKPIVARY